jgi:peptidoglycan/LPS O-acetylase OafA/YrhL
MAAPPSGVPRLLALDGLRGVAAAMVYIHHAQFPGTHPATVGFDAGVMVFFVLSGFLIHRPFVAAHAAGRRVSLISYAIRRVARILPPYVIAAVGISLLRYPEYLADPIALVTMQHAPIAVIWTLQLEVVFYVAVPIFAALLGRLTDRRRVPVLVGVGTASFVGTLLLAIAQLGATGPTLGTAFEPFPAWLWAFVPGMVLAELDVARPDLVRRLGGLPLLAVGVAMVAGSVIVDIRYLDLPAAIGSAIVLARLLQVRVAGAVAVVAAGAGAISYSVYLWHAFVIDNLARPSTWPAQALALAVTVAMAALIYVVVERPAMGLGRAISARHVDGVVRGGCARSRPGARAAPPG